jgi:hypothetical protein
MRILNRIKCALRNMVPMAIATVLTAPVVWLILLPHPSTMPDIQYTPRYNIPDISSLDLTIIYVVAMMIMTFIIYYQDCKEKESRQSKHD